MALSEVAEHKYTSTNIMGFQVFDGPLNSISLNGHRITINTLNAYSYVVAKKDKAFAQALRSSSIILPDGMPVVLASRVLKKNKQMKKIAGYDLFRHLMTMMNASGGKCFFLGSSENTLQRIKDRAAKEYPDVLIQTYSPPFKNEFSTEDNQKMIDAVNAFRPNVLFVGMTAPKQEKWIGENNNRINAGTTCAIGAVFDFYAGTVNRPGHFWVKLGLEWFIRLVKEPKRLWKRYLVSSPVFFIDLVLYFFRLKRLEK